MIHIFDLINRRGQPPDVQSGRGILGSRRPISCEVAFFSDGPHSATATALGRVTLVVVPADRLEHLVRTKPDLGIAIIRRLARMAATEDDRPAGRAGPVA
jgi:hypothetical protein